MYPLSEGERSDPYVPTVGGVQTDSPHSIGLLKVDFCITCRSWKSYKLAIVLLVVTRPAISTGQMSLSEGDDDVDDGNGQLRIFEGAWTCHHFVP